MQLRQYNTLDNIIIAIDNRLKKRKVLPYSNEKRPYPANNIPEANLSHAERQHIAGLMRVNHAGEVAAQALYKAQALTARKKELKQTMQQAANEEIDHLNWCATRLKELGEHTSYLQPLWSVGSFGIGCIAGAFGDKWNLGFLVETEYQVVKHLDNHLKQIPEHDQRSRVILEQMRKDELHHAMTAEIAGAKNLRNPVKKLMSLISGIMTEVTYYV